MKAKHAVGIALAYVAIGLGRGAYVAFKYPSEANQRDALWWARAAFAWPYDLSVSLISNASIG